MANPRLKSIGLKQIDLARLTGQSPGAISEKFKVNRRRGYRLGAREAIVIACFTVMGDEQREEALRLFECLRNEFDEEQR